LLYSGVEFFKERRSYLRVGWERKLFAVPIKESCWVVRVSQERSAIGFAFERLTQYLIRTCPDENGSDNNE
jgi:hypothetical protein